MSCVALSWSSGKDSAWALHTLRQQVEHDVAALVTTINMEYERVAMHAVHRQLVLAQAAAAGVPLIEVPIPNPCSNADYDAAMKMLIGDLKRRGIDHMAFGDLYLDDIRTYREDRLRGTGIKPLFPLWQQPTAELAQTMIDGGLKAVLTCVDPKQLAPEFSGRMFDRSLLQELPDNVDPCGENGEFHSFVFAGPMFHDPLAIAIGDTTERDGFIFTDVSPAD